MLPREIQKGWAAGFFCYLTKPFKVDELLETLDEALKFAKPRIPRPDIEDETLDQ